ncbi:MAG: ferredoxin [Lachnospiraceae bacterium]|nr:ferredoxin [Lachnospiraceae bacterium]
MKVVVDKSECISCGFCEYTCPSVFRMDDNYKSEAIERPTRACLDDVQYVIDNCPGQAIKWMSADVDY